MAEVITMPKLGFDMAEGTLIRWVILEGEEVSKGAILAEIETDKATVEVESQGEGVVLKHLVPVGEIVPVNAPIAVIADPGEEVDVDNLLNNMEVPDAEASTEEAQIVTKAEQIKAQTTSEQIEQDTHLPNGFKASPLARKMAREMGVNLQAVQGSGSGGRITKKDIELYITSPAARAQEVDKVQPSQVTKMPPLSTSLVETVPVKSSQTIPLNRLRAAIGKRMTKSKQQVPHFYVTHEYNVEALVDLRRKFNDILPDDEKISVNDYVVKAAALTLLQYPNLNASLDGNQVIQHGYINIGVAVAVEGGLLTVVCHDSDIKPIRQISQETRSKVLRAREGKVRPDDIEGSTFTVSNLGMFEVEEFTAIVNPPEAAILAVGSAREVPVVENGIIKPGMRMKATLSVDHRVSDGAEAAKFLQALKAFIEEPLRLLF